VIINIANVWNINIIKFINENKKIIINYIGFKIIYFIFLL